MKIALSTRWKIVLISLIFWEIILLIAVIKVHIYGGFAADIIMIPCAVILTSCFIIEMLPTIRYLTYVIVTEDGFDSYLFKKKLCVVHKDKPIYYGVFSIRIFTWDKESFLRAYDMKKQIAMPYDERTMLLFEIEKRRAAHYSMF